MDFFYSTVPTKKSEPSTVTVEKSTEETKTATSPDAEGKLPEPTKVIAHAGDMPGQEAYDFGKEIGYWVGDYLFQLLQWLSTFFKSDPNKPSLLSEIPGISMVRDLLNFTEGLIVAIIIRLSEGSDTVALAIKALNLERRIVAWFKFISSFC